MRAKALALEELLNAGVPGGAWFRHQEYEIGESLGETPESLRKVGLNRDFVSRSSVDDTYDLFSGGRAISENLQLDRGLQATGRENPTVDVDKMEGISIKAIDWKDYLPAEAQPKLDPLAAAIPDDQHAIFFPSFAKLLEVADQADRQGTNVLYQDRMRSEDFRVQERYERQLCLSTSALARLLGPSLVKSVAVTGSDLYFPTGTDVAILFEAKQPDILHTLLTARIAQGAASAGVDAKAIAGTTGHANNSVAYTGFRSDDRVVCVYLARLGDVVVVTNSPKQLGRLVDVHQNVRKSLARLPEYRFFRWRYPLGDADESAFAFLSDATIRRWCGPRWRIASSRRTQDLAVLEEIQARNLDSVLKKRANSLTPIKDLPSFALGDMRLGSAGVQSSTIGNVGFQTPIVEMEFDKVTEEEWRFYQQWRTSYETNWRWAFDPIGLRIHCGEKRIAADLTVMPLIANSQYEGMIDLTKGVKIAKDAGDPHDAAAQWIMAINRQSRSMQFGESMMKGNLPGVNDPLSWLGSYVSVWADDDPIWAEFSRKNANERTEFLEKNFTKFPIAFEVGVVNRLKLTAFLVAVRGMIDTTVPGDLSWEPQMYHDQGYVKVSASEHLRRQISTAMGEISLYYVILPDRMLITPNKPLLERAIDRQTARDKAKADGKSLPAIGHPWLGESGGLQLNSKSLALWASFYNSNHQEQLQRLAWQNIPILNEWKRLYPDRDPVTLHEQIWQTRLVAPGGGKYVWNEKWHTMESTEFGHPGEPKTGPELPILGDVQYANLGLTFENDGLRARAELQRASAQKK